MVLPFPQGLYKIVNVKNGNIDLPLLSTLPWPTVIPVSAAPTSGAIWTIIPSNALNIGFNVHHLVHIQTHGQPANLEQKGFLQGDKGTVVVNIGAAPNVWCLHRVIGNVYLIFFSRKGTDDHGPYHWQLLSSKPSTQVIVDKDHDHPINKLLHGHIIAGLEASLDDLSDKLRGLTQHHPDCFWEFKPLEIITN